MYRFKVLAGLAVVGVGLEIATGGGLSREARAFGHAVGRDPKLRADIMELVAKTTELMFTPPPIRCGFPPHYWRRNP